jgi:hypothetical protein
MATPGALNAFDPFISGRASRVALIVTKGKKFRLEDVDPGDTAGTE